MSIRVTLRLLLAAFLLFGMTSTVSGQGSEPSTAADVNVVNTPDVNVVNTPVRIPWSTKLSVTVTGFNKSIPVLSFPDGFPDDSYILVVETISYELEVPSGQGVNVRFCFQGGDIGPFTVYVPHVSPWSNGSRDIYADTVQVRIYAGGGAMIGDAVKAYMSRDASYGFADFTVNVMGYFLPDDSASLAP